MPLRLLRVAIKRMPSVSYSTSERRRFRHKTSSNPVLECVGRLLAYSGKSIRYGLFEGTIRKEAIIFSIDIVKKSPHLQQLKGDLPRNHS